MKTIKAYRILTGKSADSPRTVVFATDKAQAKLSATLTDAGKLEMHIKVEQGRGYVPGNVRALADDGATVLLVSHRRTARGVADHVVRLHPQPAEVIA